MQVLGLTLALQSLPPSNFDCIWRACTALHARMAAMQAAVKRNRMTKNRKRKTRPHTWEGRTYKGGYVGHRCVSYGREAVQHRHHHHHQTQRSLIPSATENINNQYCTEPTRQKQTTQLRSSSTESYCMLRLEVTPAPLRPPFPPPPCPTPPPLCTKGNFSGESIKCDVGTALYTV